MRRSAVPGPFLAFDQSATRVSSVGCAEEIAADIFGHDKPTMSYGVYSGGASLEQKHDAIMKLDYGLSTA